MSNQGRPPLSPRQEEAAKFLRLFGRRYPARATLREIAAGLGGITERVAKEHVDRLVAKGYATKEAHWGGGVVLTDEREIPVIMTSEPVARGEPLVSEERIVECVHGMLADTFDPEPDYLAIVENGLGLTQLLAVCKHMDRSDGDTIIGHFGDEIVIGKLRSGYVDIKQGTSEARGGGRRISLDDQDFRLEGVVVGEITAKTTRREP